MSAEALAQPMPVPAAIVPTPAIITPTDACGAEPTACQLTLGTRVIMTTTLSAPNTQVAHRCTATSTLCPRPDTTTVQMMKMAMQTMVSAGTDFAVELVPNRIDS